MYILYIFLYVTMKDTSLIQKYLHQYFSHFLFKPNQSINQLDYKYLNKVAAG